MTAVAWAPRLDIAVAFATTSGGHIDDGLDASLLMERVLIKFSPSVISSIILFRPVVFTLTHVSRARWDYTCIVIIVA